MNEAENNAETVRRAYQAFNSADMKTLTDRQGREATFATALRAAAEPVR